MRSGEVDTFIAPFYHALLRVPSRLGRYIRLCDRRSPHPGGLLASSRCRRPAGRGGPVTPSSVEQGFLERRGGSTPVLLVLEDPAGARTRDRRGRSEERRAGHEGRWGGRRG